MYPESAKARFVHRMILGSRINSSSEIRATLPGPDFAEFLQYRGRGQDRYRPTLQMDVDSYINLLSFEIISFLRSLMAIVVLVSKGLATLI